MSMSVFDAMLQNLAPLSVEVFFMVFFALGFAVLRLDYFKSKTASLVIRKGEKCRTDGNEKFLHQQYKTIDAEVGAGCMPAAIAAWRAMSSQGPTRMDTLRLIVQAFLDAEPNKLLEEVVGHMSAHKSTLGTARTAASVLDIVARAGRIDLMQLMFASMQERLGIQPTPQIYEVLLGGHATAGADGKVAEILEAVRSSGQRVTMRGFSLILKGFLKNSMAEASLKQMQAMLKEDLNIPPFAVTQLFRIACESGRGEEFLTKTQGDVHLTHDAVGLLLEDCNKRKDAKLAHRIEDLLVKQKFQLPSAGRETLLKLYTSTADLRALELLSEIKAANVRLSEGHCVGLISRCADSRFVRFAEELAALLRLNDGMTVALFSALMKVYAYSGMYDKACDLYTEIIERGLEPDATMYGCLMKFSVECGRTELSKDLFNTAPGLDIQNYMSLIRAAGRDRDVTGAFAVLDRLKASGTKLDIAAYNCVLDVCVIVGDMVRARSLVDEMRATIPLDIITFNTLLKGYCNHGDLASARRLLVEMEEVGLHANDVSYNCLINAAASAGNLVEAWSTVEQMEKNGIRIDRYTVSTILKSLKHTKSARDVVKALALFDRSGINVCEDEILFNSVLETCTRHREHRRLDSIVMAYTTSTMRPKIPTYGSLIKAAGALKQLNLCRKFWTEMTELRALIPTDIVLGCMLDALVCNGQIEEAVTLFRAWKSRVPANAVIYSTLMKGFATSRLGSRAMELWREMRADGVKMNTVVYNAAIDAQARVGASDEVAFLVERMEEDGCKPDLITKSTIIKSYCVKGDLSKALEVFHCIPEKDMKTDPTIFNTILDGCVRHNRMELADQLLQDMGQSRVIPSNFTLGILVKMWGRRRNLDKAFAAFESMPQRYGFVANTQVKTCLMSACINCRHVDRACKVFEGLRASNEADAAAFSIIISGTVRCGKVRQAAVFVEEAYGLVPGVKQLPNDRALPAEPLECFFQALTQQGLMEEVGLPLLEKLRGVKAPIYSQLYSRFLRHAMTSSGGQSPSSQRNSCPGKQRPPRSNHQQGQQW